MLRKQISNILLHVHYCSSLLTQYWYRYAWKQGSCVTAMFRHATAAWYTNSFHHLTTGRLQTSTLASQLSTRRFSFTTQRRTESCGRPSGHGVAPTPEQIQILSCWKQLFACTGNGITAGITFVLWTWKHRQAYSVRHKSADACIFMEGVRHRVSARTGQMESDEGNKSLASSSLKCPLLIHSRNKSRVSKIAIKIAM